MTICLLISRKLHVLTQKCQNKSSMPLLTSLLIKSIIYIFLNVSNAVHRGSI